MSKRADGPWHVVHGQDILNALCAVESGADPEAVYQEFSETAVAREDYREKEGFLEQGRLRDPLTSNDPRDLLAVIEIQRNGLEFLMRELMERNGEEVEHVSARVDFLLSQPLG